MKRLLLIAALVLLPTAAFAQASNDRDVLLTSDGKLFTIDSVVDASGNNRSLHLMQQVGTNVWTTDVPETLNNGINWRPALAYDDESKTLFVFWLHMPTAFSSELLIATLQNATWHPAFSLDNQQWDLRYNLKIGITHHVSTLQADGTYADAPGLLVHAVWWEQTSAGDQARYAMLTIEKGWVTSYEIHNLSEFASQPDKPFDVGSDFNPEILKHPAIIEGTDSIDVVFGDMNTRSINRVTLKPIADGRIHIPIGHHGGGPLPPPQAFSADWTSRISLVAAPGDSRMAFYSTDKDGLHYVLFLNGTWSDMKTIATNGTINEDAALNALTRLVAISGQ